jgi:hypothetical protein
MANVTVSVPEDLKKKMEQVGGVNWSEVARQAFEEAVRRREMLEAAQNIDRIREETKSPGWSGAREIRKWRDADRKQWNLKGLWKGLKVDDEDMEAAKKFLFKHATN